MHDLSPDTDWAALARYLSGESASGEAEAIRRWIDASPERSILVDGLRQVWSEAAVPQGEWDVEAALPRIMDGALALEVILRATAVDVDASWHGRSGCDRGILVGFSHWGAVVFRRPAAGITAVKEYVMPRERYATIVLADGTRITLAPMSGCACRTNLNRTSRDVYLDGQAFLKSRMTRRGSSGFTPRMLSRPISARRSWCALMPTRRVRTLWSLRARVTRASAPNICRF